LGGHLGFASNATHIAMRVHGHAGFAAFAIATGEVVHSLIMMQEADVAIYALVAAVASEGGLEARVGEAGIPTATAPPPPGHEDMDHRMETQFAYGQGLAVACTTPLGWLVLAVARADVSPGGEWDVLVALDALPEFLPHPIGSTHNATFHVVAAQPGGDAMALQAQLDAAVEGRGETTPGVPAWLALLGLLGAAAAASRRT
jgi:hypothetical protein